MLNIPEALRFYTIFGTWVKKVLNTRFSEKFSFINLYK